MSVKLIRITALVAAMLLGCSASHGQRTTRPGLKLLRDVAPETTVTGDTIALDSTNVDISGYEKTLRSTVESAFVTNLSTDDYLSITLDIQYLDMKGRQLHQRRVQVDAVFPAGETRMARFSTWDKQKVWYYHLSDPVRTRMQATPYKVIIIPVSAIASKSLERTDSIDK